MVPGGLDGERQLLRTGFRQGAGRYPLERLVAHGAEKELMTAVVKILEGDTAAPLAASEWDIMKCQLNVPSGYDFVTATRMVAMLEAVAPRLNVVDRLHLGRLMVSSGHSITLTCRKT
jgi:hypothetical protein